MKREHMNNEKRTHGTAKRKNENIRLLQDTGKLMGATMGGLSSIETLKATKHLNVDLQKFYDVAKLGSGNSGALNRITDKAIAGDYKGYIFSVKNTLKDMTYINELLSDLPNAEKLASLTKSFYQDAVDRGEGDLLISELINKT